MRLVVASLVLLAHAVLAAAQQPPAQMAQIEGTIVDVLGAPMAGVTVSLLGGSDPRTTVTDKAGDYRIDGIVPGVYELHAIAEHLRESTRRVVLEPGAVLRVDLEVQAAHAETVVVSATREPVSLMRAPGAMSVVDSRDIETSAAENVPDLLRGVPGVNLSQTSARDFNINTRSASGILSNSMLVMLDGRSFFQPLYGAVYWDLMTVTAGEIAQIEVLRSPASALWGANALNGVINVRTKSPRQMEGLRGYLGFGERGTKSAGVMWADSTDRLSYKLSGSYFEQEPWDRDNVLPNGSPMPPTAIFENRGASQPKVDVRVDWDADRSRVWSIRGGVAGASGLTHSALGPGEFAPGSYSSYLELDRRTDDVDFKVYWNRLEAPFRIVLYGLDEDATNDTYVAELTRRLRVGAKQGFTFGGSVRLDRFATTIAPDDNGRVDVSAFVEDKVRVSEIFNVVVGGRLDKFDTTSLVFAPRLGLVVNPKPDHAFRVTYNRAYRAPSLLENFLNVTLPATPPSEPTFQYPLLTLGSTDLEMEKQDAFEVGYTGALNSRTAVFATVYSQRISNAVWFLPVSFYGPGAPPPGWPGDPFDAPFAPAVFTFVNIGEVRDRGIELATNIEWPRLTIHGSYSFQDVPRLSGTSLPLTFNRPAQHHVGGGVTFVTDRWSASGDAQFTDTAFWADVLTQEFWGSTDAYLGVNARVSYRLPNLPWELSLSATDLLDAKIKSHVYGDTIRRKVVAGVRWQWDK